MTLNSDTIRPNTEHTERRIVAYLRGEEIATFPNRPKAQMVLGIGKNKRSGVPSIGAVLSGRNRTAYSRTLAKSVSFRYEDEIINRQ